MRTVSVRLADLERCVIPIGYAGENLHTQVRIDCKKAFEEYPTAVVSLAVRNPKGDEYPAVIVREGDIVKWNVTNSDLAYDGTGGIQLKFTVDEVVKRSDNGKVSIGKSILANGEAPDPIKAWIDQADEILEEVEAAVPKGGTTSQILAKKSNSDRDTEWVDPPEGTTDYDDLENRPQIGGVTLTGDKSLHDLGIAAESAIPEVPVKDVRLNDTSLIGQDGKAEIPIAGMNTLGAVQTYSGYGINIATGNSAGRLSTDKATSQLIKAETDQYRPIVPYNQHEAVFYGLAKVAGQDEKNSENPVGTYSAEAKTAIKTMLGVAEPTSIIDDTEKGAGKTYSSNKIDSELQDVKSEISQKQDAPSAIGTAGQVLGLNNDLEPEWIDQPGGSVDPQDIEDAVDAWLDENITNPDSPPLDRSLSSASSAAPADMLGAVDSELEMQTISVDLLANATHTEGRKIDPDGNIQNVSTYDIYEIDYDGTYSKFDAVLYSSSNYLLRAMTFHDENGTALETDEFLNTSGDYKSTFTDKAIPAGTKKIYLSYRNTMGPISASYKKSVSNRLSEIEGDIDTLSVFPVSSKNLFDESKKVVGLIYEANGSLMDSYTAHRASDYIEVDAGTIYTISAYHKNTGAFNIEGLRYAFYTSNKTFISGAKPEGAYSTFRTPSNAKYIRFSMLQTNTDKWQLERRSFATKYVPFNTITYNDESDEMFMNFPAKTYAVTGLEYNLYLFNVRPEKGENEFRSRYYIPTITSIARYGRFLRLKGNNTSTAARVIGAEAKSITKYGYKLFSINVKDPTNLSAVSVLILGDSTTANGYVPQYLYEFGGNSHLITTLGTQGTAPYNHEGRSGWRLYDYFNTSSGNPFYNPSTETFDAAYYFTNSGVSQPDIFIINLGINDMHYDSNTPYEAKAHADGFISMVNDVITSVKGVSSSIKVAICLTTPPNTDPYSFGSAGSNIIDYDDYRIANLILCEKLIDAFDYRESEGIYLIPINACLDTKYNMPTTTEHPNSRSDLEITVPNNAANVHPNTAGYHQIADEMYAFICSLYVT